MLRVLLSNYFEKYNLLGSDQRKYNISYAFCNIHDTLKNIDQICLIVVCF